jgi:acyl carrier protein
MVEDAMSNRQALEMWLRERIAKELKKAPTEIDLEQPADSFSLDSLTVVEICAELGNAIQGREIQIEQWWKAESLRALCESFFGPASRRAAAIEAPPESRKDPTPLGAPLAQSDAGRALFLVLRERALVAAGERSRFAGVTASPDLLSLAYRQIDESTGAPRDTVYYGGSYMSNLRAWVTPSGSGDGHDIYVLNTGGQTVEVIVAAWTSSASEVSAP